MWILWLRCDTEASWNKVINVIDSPAIANRFTIPSNMTLEEAVDYLESGLKAIANRNRYNDEDDNSLLTSPKHFTSVALIHHKGQQTKKEVLAIAILHNYVNFDLSKIHTIDEYFKQCKCTKNISDIFAEVTYADGIPERPGIILIEGVPGIGKTVLSNEILFQWANGNLLSDKKFVFLIYLRDTESHKINSLESFVNYVCCYPEVAEHILKYMIDNKGKNVTIVFDGFDELSEEQRSDYKSFLYKMMIRKNFLIPYCNVVITSRPNASTNLRNKVDLRVEILGFTDEDKKAYITQALEGDKNKADIIFKYLNDYPAIDSYCYIPLNMTILLSYLISIDFANLTELPNTQTEINEKFICTTISRYIGRNKTVEIEFLNFSDIRSPCDEHEIGKPCIGHEKGVPYGRIMKEISKLAFKALEKDKIVFTIAELQEACPCLEAHSENWDGLGLLKAVKFFSFDNNLRNVSYNFLHFTTQEILAAYHITLMSEVDQIKCMQETFWNNRYYNVWIMYVGLTKNQLPVAFQHFLSGNWFRPSTYLKIWWNKGAYYDIKKDIITDKVKRLYLFQCFSEAGNKHLCQYVGKLLQKKEIDLSDQTQSAINLYKLSLFLGRSTTKEWNTLNLSKCFIGDNGIDQLYKSFTSNNRSNVCIDTLILLHNGLTQSSNEFIARLIREWNVKKLYIDETEIKWNSLNESIMHEIMQQPIQLANNNNISIMCDINERVTFFVRLSESEYVNFTLNCDSFPENARHKIMTSLAKPQGRISETIIHTLCNHSTISYLNLNTTQCEINDIIRIFKSNKSINFLFLQKMYNSSLNETIQVFNALQSNVSLRYVDMSLISINTDLVKVVAPVVKNNTMLEDIKVSELILRHDDFLNLEKHLVKFKGLKHLSFTGCTFGDHNIDNVEVVIINNNELESLHLSHCKILDQVVNKFVPTQNAYLKYLNIHNDQQISNEVGQIFRNLKLLNFLQCVDLTGNLMSNYSISDIEEMIKHNMHLQKLCLPNCVFNKTELRIIFQAVGTVSSLQYVDFSTSKVDNELASDVALLLTNNTNLKQLKFSKICLDQNGFKHLKTVLVKLHGIVNFSITNCSFTDQDAANIAIAISNNTSIQELDLSNCNMFYGMDIFKQLTITSSLHCLRLNDITISDKMEDEVIAIVNNNSNLEDLEMAGCYMSRGFYIKLINCPQFRKISKLNFSCNSVVSKEIKQLLPILSSHSNLKSLDLSNCKLKSNEVTQIFYALRKVKCLQYFNLSANKMNDCVAADIRTLFINNKNIQKFYLPDCVLDQTSLRVIIQAMQTVSSLEYIDLNRNKIDNDLAGDIALLFDKNSKLQQLKFARLELKQNGFKCLINTHLKKIKGLKYFTCIGCTFNDQDVLNLATAIGNNSEIQELDLSYSKVEHNMVKVVHIFSKVATLSSLSYLKINNITITEQIKDQIISVIHNGTLEHLEMVGCNLSRNVIKAINCRNLLHINFSCNREISEALHDLLSILSYNTKLKSLWISNCYLKSREFVEICKTLKNLRQLECIDFSGNTMTNDVTYDLVSTIINNKNLKKLFLPECDLYQPCLRIIIQAMQKLSSLQCIDFSTNKVDNELASDIAFLCANNTCIEQIKFTEIKLDQNGFKLLKRFLVKLYGIKNFSITKCNLSDPDTTNIANVISNNANIQELDLSNCNMFYGMDIFKQLTVISSLHCLKLNGITISDKMKDEVIAIINNNNSLEHLEMAGCTMSRGLCTKLINCTQFKKISRLNFRCNSFLRGEIKQLLPVLSSNLKSLDLSNCQLKSNEINQIFSVLKKMKYLQCVDLSANTLIDDVADEIADMISNNKNIQKLILPDCVLHQSSLRIIIQAMQTVSSLQYVDLNKNIIDNELAFDVSDFILKNRELKEIKIFEIMLDQNGFQHLKDYVFKIKGLKLVSITGCIFNREDAYKLETVIRNNFGVHQLKLLNCEIDINQLLSIFSCKLELQWLELYKCQLQTNHIKQIFNILKQMKYLQHVDLRENFMSSDPINELAAMIKNSKQIQTLYLPECTLKDQDLRIIIQAMHSISSLEYVDFSTNKVDNELANDIAILCANNTNLKKLKFTEIKLDHNGYNFLKRSLVYFYGIKQFSITDCNFNDQDEENIAIALNNNKYIQKLDLSNCKMLYSVNIFKKLAATSLLQCLVLNNITIIDQMEDELIAIINNNSNLKHLEMAGCNMSKQFYVTLINCPQFKKITNLNINQNSVVNKEINQLLPILSSHTYLKSVNLSNCQLKSNEVNQIFKVLKRSNYLRCVDLSANAVTDDVAKDIADMISNNSGIQKLILPDCVLHQTSLRIIFQAMQTVSSLQYVDLNSNNIDNILASDIALLVTKNIELKGLKLSQITLNQSGFLHLKNYVSKITGLQVVRITECFFTRPDATKLKTLISNNSGISELNLSSCIMHTDQLLSILSFNTMLRGLDLSKCHFHYNEIKQIFNILKPLNYLQHVDLHANLISSDAIDELAAMIKNNKQIQAINLSDCILNKDLKIIFEAMRDVSSLQYVDFSTNKVDNELASDVAIFCTSNCNLKQLKVAEIKLSQNGFEYLKTFLMKFHGIKYFSITDCNFTDQDAANVAIAISNNIDIQELNLSNCTMFYKVEIFKQLSATSLLQSLKLNNITITDQVGDEVIAIINNNSNLEHLEMAGCNMSNILYIKLINCPQFKKISKVNFSCNSVVSKGIKQLLPILSSHSNLKSLNLSNCQLKPNEIQQTLRVLKELRYLQCVDLSQNTMMDDFADDIVDMIINNKDIQEVLLTDCVVNQTSLRIIIQAMKTVSSLQLVDLSTNTVNDELAGTTAILAANCNKLEQLKFAKLQSSFQHQGTFLIKFEGTKHFSIIDCTFDDQNATVLEILVDSNHSIEELFISNYRNNATDNIGKFAKLNV